MNKCRAMIFWVAQNVCGHYGMPVQGGHTVQYRRTHSTVQYSAVQYSTVKYSTVQYSTVQYSTVQYSAVQYSKHLHTNNTQNNTMKQNTQNGTYITIRIHKYNNKYIIYKIKQKHTNHTTIYTTIQNRTKGI